MTDPSTIRRQALEEALAAVEQVERRCWGSDGHPLIDRVDARTAIQALLAADPREASEPLQSARFDHAPVDHGPGAAANGETGIPWYKRKFGSAHTRRCRRPNIITCARPECQMANACQAADYEASEVSDDSGQLPAKTYRDGIRACIDELGGHDGMAEARDILSALLPQPKDEAEALVEEMADTSFEADDPVMRGALMMARHVLSQGWRAPA